LCVVVCAPRGSPRARGSDARPSAEVT
jgi:hypothetical protein